VSRSSLLRTLDPDGPDESLPITRVSANSPAQSAAPVAQVAPPSPAPEPPASVTAPACPRCSGRLTDPGGLGWCQACGYCHSLEEEKARVPSSVPAAAGPSSPLGSLEMVEVVRTLPRWVWLMLGGVLAIVGATFIPGLQLPRTGLLRAAWCTVQLVVGLVLVFAAQIWALLQLAHQDEKLGNRDAFMPVRLWVLTFRHLPHTWRQVCLAAWGVALFVAALLIVGGLGHWWTYLPKRPNTPAVWSNPH